MNNDIKNKLYALAESLNDIASELGMKPLRVRIGMKTTELAALMAANLTSLQLGLLQRGQGVDTQATPFQAVPLAEDELYAEAVKRPFIMLSAVAFRLKDPRNAEAMFQALSRSIRPMDTLGRLVDNIAVVLLYDTPSRPTAGAISRLVTVLQSEVGAVAVASSLQCITENKAATVKSVVQTAAYRATQSSSAGREKA